VSSIKDRLEFNGSNREGGDVLMVMFTNDNYEKEMYERIMSHSTCLIELDMDYPGHEFISATSITSYIDGENVAIECTKCDEVIIQFDKPRGEN
jgi:hypothetical protein